MKIGVFTHYDAYFEPVAAITVPIMREYCERHGYHFEAVTERLSDRRVVWDKVKLLLEGIDRGYDWTIHLDCDVLLTNLFLDVEHHLLNKAADVILSRDIHGVNMGVVLVAWGAKPWLEYSWRIGEREEIGSEQHAMIVGLHENPPYCVVTLPQSYSNCYPFSQYEQDYHKGSDSWAWKPGQFLMHLPGMPNDKRVEIFARVLPEIVR